MNLEDRIKMIIGEYAMQNVALAVQLEESKRRLSEQESLKEKPKSDLTND